MFGLRQFIENWAGVRDAFFQPQRTLTDDSSHVTDEIILIVRIE